MTTGQFSWEALGMSVLSAVAVGGAMHAAGGLKGVQNIQQASMGAGEGFGGAIRVSMGGTVSTNYRPTTPAPGQTGDETPGGTTSQQGDDAAGGPTSQQGDEAAGGPTQQQGDEAAGGAGGGDGRGPKPRKPAVPDGFEGGTGKLGKDLEWPTATADGTPVNDLDIAALREKGVTPEWARAEAEIYRAHDSFNPDNPTAARRAAWLDALADRFFLVSGELPDGDFAIVGADGERRVDAIALKPYEVGRERAEAHVRAEMEAALASVAVTLGRALGVAGARPPDLRKAAERLGVRGGDRRATEAAIRSLAADMHAVTAAVTSGNAAGLERARARLQARGLDPGDALDELPRQLEALRRLDQQDVERGAAAGLRALADSIEETGEQPLGRRIDELIERLEREVGPWIGRDPEKIRERRQEEYRTSARSSIADSLREAGITPLNDPREEKR